VRTADAVATEGSELLVIDRRDFIPLVHQTPDVALKLIELVCARLRRTSDQVEDAVFLDLPQRLAKVLLEMHSRASSDYAEIISITQRDLIPSLTDQNPCAHWRNPSVMMRQG
jgi:CRP-like cAMP-binding protein